MLARRFAPVLVFSDKAQGYPVTAQDYYAAGGCMGRSAAEKLTVQ